jgi:peptide/nickel transport system permease protein
MSESVALSAGRLASLRLRRISLVLALCFVIVGGVVVMAIVGPVIAPFDPGQIDLSASLERSTNTHWFGTDVLGRDIVSRIIAGARLALLGPLVVAASSMVIGNILGLRSAYRGGRIDGLTMRWVDLMWAVPGLLVIIVVAGAFGGGYWWSVGLLIVLTIPFDTRVVRGAALEQLPLPYVEAAKALGVSDRRIMFLHIWPNISGVAVANTFLIFSGTLVSLAGLSFLGIGVHPGTPDWGLMVAENRALLFASPLPVLAPALMIVLTAAAMNLIGDWLYDRLSNRGATR